MSGDPYKGYACEHCLSHFVYSDSLDRHRSRCHGTERLRLEVRDLKKRIRLAHKELPAVGLDDGTAFDRCVDALDLRKPLRTKGKR